MSYAQCPADLAWLMLSSKLQWLRFGKSVDNGVQVRVPRFQRKHFLRHHSIYHLARKDWNKMFAHFIFRFFFFGLLSGKCQFWRVCLNYVRCFFDNRPGIYLFKQWQQQGNGFLHRITMMFWWIICEIDWWWCHSQMNRDSLNFCAVTWWIRQIIYLTQATKDWLFENTDKWAITTSVVSYWTRNGIEFVNL